MASMVDTVDTSNISATSTTTVTGLDPSARTVCIYQDDYLFIAGHKDIAFIMSLDLDSFGFGFQLKNSTAYCSTTYNNYIIVGCQDYHTYVYDMPRVFKLANKVSAVYTNLKAAQAPIRHLSVTELDENDCIAKDLSDHTMYVFSMTKLYHYLITGSYDNTMIVYDMDKNFEKLKQVTFPHQVFSLYSIPFQHNLICVGQYQSIAELFRLEDVLQFAPSVNDSLQSLSFREKHTAYKLQIPGANGNILGIDYHHKLELVAVGGGDAKIAILNLKNKKHGVVTPGIPANTWIGYVHFVQQFNTGNMFTSRPLKSTLKSYTDVIFIR